MSADGGAPTLVVGAGTTGLTMACELARHRAPVRIIDRLAGVNPHCRATGIHARTLEVFHDLGVVDEMLAAGHKLRGMTQYAAGRPFSRVTFADEEEDSPYPFTLSLEQNRTETILEGLLRRLGPAVERRTELIGLAEHPDGVRATLRRPDGSEELVDTPWLIGCDGAHSTVRHLRHQGFPGQEDPYQYVLADVRAEGPISRDEGQGFLGDRGVLFVFPLPAGRMILIANLAEHHDAVAETPSLEDVQALVAERGPAGLRVDDPRWLSYFRIHYRLTRHYRHGRVFLAGDAVHVHSPVGGQGMNTGIQDAYNLAWKLALVVRGAAPAALLDTYERERRRVAEDVLELTKRMTDRSEAFSHLSPAERERLYINVVVPETERRRMARHVDELDLDYRGSPICAEAHGPRSFAGGPRAGAEAPDAKPLRRADRSLTLFDLLRGPRHTVLLFPGPRTSGRRLGMLSASAAGTRADLVDAHVVVSGAESAPPDLPGGVSVVFDPQGAVRQRYGVRGECAYVIRPDGYVGHRCAPASATRLREYFQRVFLPAPRARRSPARTAADHRDAR
jgi:2-polyprenyl-6-methoxyphenol hydroxylase-like FAD-dependent oxidoreductase